MYNPEILSTTEILLNYWWDSDVAKYSKRLYLCKLLILFLNIKKVFENLLFDSSKFCLYDGYTYKPIAILRPYRDVLSDLIFVDGFSF